MIAKLTGILDQIGADGAVIDVSGVGYLVFCSTRTLGQLPRRAAAARLLIETHVREDHIHLYGFVDAAERDWFRLLTTVQGVGAQAGAGDPVGRSRRTTLTLAIVAQDKATLARADGVGPKLAARIVNELKDKVGGLALAATNAAAPARGRRRAGATGDAVSALVNLGYRRAEAFGAVAAASRRLGGEAKLDALIRAGLQELAQNAEARA